MSMAEKQNGDKEHNDSDNTADENKIEEEIAKLGLTYANNEDRPKKIGHYVLGEILGSGAYGDVREAIDSRTLKRVATKIINLTKAKKIKGAEEALKNEILIMRSLNHKNVLKLFDVLENKSKTKIYLVLEFCGAGSLQQVIDSHSDKRLPISDCWKQLIEGVEYLHQQGVIHRDIKPSNLMITPDGVLKISDFGVSIKLPQFENSDVCTTTQGTPAFQSPQIAMGQKSYSGFKLDIWACGVTLYLLITGTYPFKGNTVFELYDSIAKAQVEFPFWVEEDLKNLIQGMLEKEESSRFTIQQIKNHPWYKKKLLEDRKPFSIGLVDRWRSFSLLPYIQKAVNNSSTDVPTHVNPLSVLSNEEEVEEKKCPIM